MQRKLRWGILSTAKIARTKVIPALLNSATNEIVAIGSRSLGTAQACAHEFSIAAVYGSYQELLDDPNVEAIYNPLPNDLHIPWSIAALKAGKHVLCEKPLGLNTADAQQLLEVSLQYPNLCAMEAFMYRFHPQWQAVKNWLAEGVIGDVRAVQTYFTYNNHEPANIRNNPAAGGGALMDIGCYGISVARWVLNSEPVRVVAQLDIHADYQVDQLALLNLEFNSGAMASVLCGTKMESGQGVYISGTLGSITIERPFYSVGDEPNRVQLRQDGEITLHEFPAIDQYQYMVEAFAQSCAQAIQVPTPLNDALANMQVIDAAFSSASSGQWQLVNAL
ncbi:MAG TPA: Gfo/Idh/MocA family oxidoreductase [Cellvibrionaceae bacterium]